MDFRNTKFKRALAALSAAVMGAALIAPTAVFADDESDLPEVYYDFLNVEEEASVGGKTISVPSSAADTCCGYDISAEIFEAFKNKPAVDDFNEEHPELFYSADDDDAATINTILYLWSLDSRFGSEAAAIDKFSITMQKVESVVNSMDPSMTDLSKIIYVNEYLVKNCKYNLTVAMGGELPNHQVGTAYNCMFTGDAVCQGYAEAFWMFMYHMGIDCKIVTTSADLSHAWNLVKLNNKWYHVDSTWNDGMLGDPVGNSNHDHLLKSDSYFRNNGHACESWYDMYVDPTFNTGAANYATDTSYDNYFWNNARSNISIVNNRYYYLDAYNWTVNLATATGATKTLLTINPDGIQWPATMMDYGTYWKANLGGFTVYKDKMLFSTPDSIVCADIDGSNARDIYTLTAAQQNYGYIYGNLTVDGNTLNYGVSPNYDLQLYSPGISDDYVYSKADLVLRKVYKYTLDLSKYVSTTLAKPTVKATAGNGRVALSWNAVSGATKYRVFYRLSGASKWTTVDTTATSRTITGLTNGKTYQFLVRATDGTNWSAYTSANIVTATPKAAAGKPTITSITPGVNKVVIRWNAVSGARSYRVYYRIYGTSAWSYKNTTVNAMNLTGLRGGRTYEFLVRSYNGSTWSSFTSADIKKAKPTAAIAKPTISSVTAGTGRAVVRWNAVSGAQSYRVYYRVYGTSAWSYKNTTVNAMNVTGLRSGKTYEFVVRAYNGSTWSSFTSADIRRASIA